MIRKVFVALAIGFISSLPAETLAQSFRSGASFWTPPNSTSQCRSSYQGIPSYQLIQTLTRKPYPNDDGVNFSTQYSMWLAEVVAGRNVEKHKANLLKIASAQTFTKPNIKGGWSPIYIQSNLIKMTAMFVVTLDSRGQLSPAEKEVLIAWGDKMLPGQKGSKGNSSADSRMASGVAMLAWGSLKGDQRLMKTGYKKFNSGYDYVLKSVGNIKRHPGHKGIPVSSLSLENEYNIAMQHAVEGAAVLRNLGIDVAAKSVNGNNLHTAVGWWTGEISRMPVNGEFTKAWSHNYHVGWIPIYIRMYGNQPASPKLRAYGRKVTSGRSPSFRAVSLGGATDCLW